MDPGVLATKTALRGNCLPIRLVPVGTQVFCVGSTVRKGAVFCRSAGTYAIVVSKEETSKKIKDVVIKMQSGEVRKVDPDACATIGVASNPNHNLRQLGKAGKSRWLGIRPTVRGVAMNSGKYFSVIQDTDWILTIFQSIILMVEVEVKRKVGNHLSVLGAYW